MAILPGSLDRLWSASWPLSSAPQPAIPRSENQHFLSFFFLFFFWLIKTHWWISIDTILNKWNFPRFHQFKNKNKIQSTENLSDWIRFRVLNLIETSQWKQFQEIRQINSISFDWDALEQMFRREFQSAESMEHNWECKLSLSEIEWMHQHAVPPISNAINGLNYCKRRATFLVLRPVLLLVLAAAVINDPASGTAARRWPIAHDTRHRTVHRGWWWMDPR